VAEISTEVLVVGGGLGGVAAALAAARRGRQVVLTEETDWLGGQLTAQAVPSDEHPWIEQFGRTETFRQLREHIRDYYRRWYPLRPEARGRHLMNPGAATVSKLSAEPHAGVAAIDGMLAPHRANGRLDLRYRVRPVAADIDGDRVRAVTVAHLDTGERVTITAPIVIDATECGDLLPLTGTEYVTGFESQEQTGEPSAPAEAQPANMQAVSVCFAIDHVAGDHIIDRPASYEFWRAYEPKFWGGPLLGWNTPNPRTLAISRRSFTPNPDDDPDAVVADQRLAAGDANLWTFRRIAARRNFTPGAYDSDICLVNWPMIDYFLAPVIDVPDAAAHLAAARQLSYSALYWLQTEAPRPDGGTGFPSLRLRGDITGSADGLAQAPYYRESRRIAAEYTVVEQDLSMALRGDKGAVPYPDTVGVGMYRIDLHPSTGGDNYIDVAASPFRIPLGALIPVRMENLLPAGKNIGTTHITNGCYRLHPVEWNIGEAAGTLAAHCLQQSTTPRAVRNDPARLASFQARLAAQGVELHWPDIAGY
jgi:hypothetical protein